MATTGRPFDATLELGGIRFRVTATNEGSINRLTIVPSGLENDNRPIERDGDSNNKPTGGTRQLQYKLRAGEAGPQLRLDRVVEY